MTLKAILAVTVRNISGSLSRNYVTSARFLKKCTNFEMVGRLIAQNYKDRFWWYLAEIFNTICRHLNIIHSSINYC